MKPFLEAIRQDLKAAGLAFDEDDFESMNVYANRIMSNAAFSEAKSVGIKGFFLKDVALEYLKLRRRRDPTALTTAKTFGKNYINSLVNSLEKSKDNGQMWKTYLEFCDKIRDFSQDTIEQKAYTKDNLPFTRHAFKWLIQYLDEERETLLNSNSVFLNGIVSEMSRIYRVHGGELFELYAFSLTTSLLRYYQYLCLENIDIRGILDTAKVKEKLFPYLDSIIAIFTQENELNASEIDNILWDLIVKWRKAFIRFMELPGRVVRRERRIEVPEDLKEKLRESIAKSLESQVR